jgi:hypothetical protein
MPHNRESGCKDSVAGVDRVVGTCQRKLDADVAVEHYLAFGAPPRLPGLFSIPRTILARKAGRRTAFVRTWSPTAAAAVVSRPDVHLPASEAGI